ncbi:MAG TPA: GNAT family N-acetyltransferase [Actinomycetota bacterium]
MDGDVAERIARGMVEAWRDRVSHIEGHAIYEADGLLVALSNLPDDELNVALVELEPQDPLGALSRAEWWFRSHGRRLGVELERGRHPAIERAARMLGLFPAVTRPAMAAAVAELGPPVPPEGVAFRRVETPEDLSAMVDLEVEIFGTERSVAERLLGPRALERTRTRMTIATLEGEPVAMAYVHVHDGAIGVFGVGTVDRLRRRGIGTAVTASAIGQARGEADLAWLQPTALGRGVYEAMGFRPVAHWQVWMLPAARRHAHAHGV